MTTEAEEKALRYRRAQSVTRAEEITEKEKKVRQLQLDKPIHKPRDSLFSWSSEFADFTGLVNWGFLMLTIGGLRLCLENFLKYGIRVNPIEWIIVLTGSNEGNRHQYPSIILLICTTIVSKSSNRICKTNIGICKDFNKKLYDLEWGHSVLTLHLPNLVSVVPIVLSLLVEKAIAVDMMKEKIGLFLQISNIIFVVALPVAVLQFKGEEFSFEYYVFRFLTSFYIVNDVFHASEVFRIAVSLTYTMSMWAVGITTVCMIYLIIFLKLWSYVQTNHWCRRGLKAKSSKNTLRRQSLSAPNWNELVNATQEQTLEDERSDEAAAAGIVKYPDNLYLKDLFYFLFAPTLCYELNFPRTTRIRKRFLLKRLLEVVFGVNLALALFQQWMIPSVKNSVDTFSEMDPIRITERLLKLAVPNHFIWLCFFYLTFHSFLNLMGELLQFADRKFYGDWWNANNMAVFWSSWNMPVHMWAVRHVYIPITQKGYSKVAASGVVFLISAFFHEFLVSVPLQMFRIWAFLGMMAQPPLSVISRFVEVKLGPRWGNLIVWSSLILGQPLAIMMYYHDYAVTHLTQ